MAPSYVGDSVSDGTYFDEQDPFISMLIHTCPDGGACHEQCQLQSMLMQSIADGKKIFSLAGGKMFLLIGDVPGATGSTKHEPGFLEKADELKSKGLSEILCPSVDGHALMHHMAWTPSVASVETTPPMMPSSLSSTNPAHYASNYQPPMFPPHPYNHQSPPQQALVMPTYNDQSPPLQALVMPTYNHQSPPQQAQQAVVMLTYPHDASNYQPPMFPPHPYNHQSPPQQALVMPTYNHQSPPQQALVMPTYNHQSPPQQALVIPTYPYPYPQYPYYHPGNTQNTGNGKKEGTGKKILKTVVRVAVPLTVAGLIGFDPAGI